MPRADAPVQTIFRRGESALASFLEPGEYESVLKQVSFLLEIFTALVRVQAKQKKRLSAYAARERLGMLVF